MNLTKIESIDQIKMTDKIAITNYSLEETSVSNMNLLIGYVDRIVRSNNEVVSVDITTMNTVGNKVVLTDSALKFKSVYTITKDKEQKNNDTIIKSNNERLIKSNNILIKKLEKSEKLNRKYRAMLIKKFGATKEQIDSNFAVKKKKKEFIEYKVIHDKIPCFINGEQSFLYGEFIFSSNNDKKIKCKLKVFSNSDIMPKRLLFSVTSIASCNKDDIFNLDTGEYIASSKAITQAIIKAH